MAPSAGCVVFPAMLNRWAIEVEKVNNWVHPGLGFAQEDALKGGSSKEVEDICKRKKAQGPKLLEKEVWSEEAMTISAEEAWAYLLFSVDHSTWLLLPPGGTDVTRCDVLMSCKLMSFPADLPTLRWSWLVAAGQFSDLCPVLSQLSEHALGIYIPLWKDVNTKCIFGMLVHQLGQTANMNVISKCCKGQPCLFEFYYCECSKATGFLLATIFQIKMWLSF